MSRIGVSGLSMLIFPKPCDSVVAAAVLVCARADDLGDEHERQAAEHRHLAGRRLRLQQRPDAIGQPCAVRRQGDQPLLLVGLALAAEQKCGYSVIGTRATILRANHRDLQNGSPVTALRLAGRAVPMLWGRD